MLRGFFDQKSGSLLVFFNVVLKMDTSGALGRYSPCIKKSYTGILQDLMLWYLPVTSPDFYGYGFFRNILTLQMSVRFAFCNFFLM